jgi:hypothetical protein
MRRGWGRRAHAVPMHDAGTGRADRATARRPQRASRARLWRRLQPGQERKRGLDEHASAAVSSSSQTRSRAAATVRPPVASTAHHPPRLPPPAGSLANDRTEWSTTGRSHDVLVELPDRPPAPPAHRARRLHARLTARGRPLTVPLTVVTAFSQRVFLLEVTDRRQDRAHGSVLIDHRARASRQRYPVPVRCERGRAP